MLKKKRRCKLTTKDVRRIQHEATRKSFYTIFLVLVSSWQTFGRKYIFCCISDNTIFPDIMSFQETFLFPLTGPIYTKIASNSFLLYQHNFNQQFRTCFNMCRCSTWFANVLKALKVIKAWIFKKNTINKHTTVITWLNIAMMIPIVVNPHFWAHFFLPSLHLNFPTHLFNCSITATKNDTSSMMFNS